VIVEKNKNNDTIIRVLGKPKNADESLDRSFDTEKSNC